MEVPKFMQAITLNQPDEARSFLRKTQLVELLERICQSLELTNTQFDTAKARYEAVGKWLSEGSEFKLKSAAIYPQGSISLGTTVRPLGVSEFDVDLVCHLAGLTSTESPGEIKKLIGNRLRENARYQDMIEEKPRCWRLNYANEFHLDITPSVPNTACSQGGELVPDKRLKTWKETNPKGYRQWFNIRAELQPRFSLKKAQFAEARAGVEAFPEPTQFKGILKRCVQLFKRHRDVHFSKMGCDLAPISIIITTLVARSYAYCVTNFIYDAEIDVLIDVLRLMPRFIETLPIDGGRLFFVWNETTHGENFAEKWNTDRRLPQAFYEWNAKAISDFENLAGITGLDRIGKELALSFGEAPVNKALSGLTGAISDARSSKLLSVSPILGLSPVSSLGVSVRHNTFFGA
jgi:hypothetical protein